jgi:hypothetical protein
MTILTKERVDELIEICKDYIDSDNPVMGNNEQDIVDALAELSELRKLVIDSAQGFNAIEEGVCHYCQAPWEFDDEKPVHSPNCPVLRYADYKQEE